eukprot:TRINITY_DN9751_c0_g1_i2.p1 TRINITY_DN9751_c0_g1~~TRINITY_DN9751_c0_g1_i2.p1  ORF type:complete len:542 (+),score=125.50 TRINITY_DN9751_c0_g1_i2:3-1628(+)
MWHGGSNFDRWVGGPFVVTSYDYDVALDEYGLPNEPKYSHLAALHSVLHQYQDVILSSPPSQGQNVTEDGSLKVYRYDNGTMAVKFLINWSTQPNIPTDDVTADFENKYYLPGWSACIIVSNSSDVVVFNTSEVFSYSTPDVAPIESQSMKTSPPSSNFWYWPEPIAGSQAETIDNISPLPQLGITFDLTDYLWYITNVSVPCETGCELYFSAASGETNLFINGEYISSAYTDYNSQVISFATSAATPYQIQILNAGMGLANNGPHMELWDLGLLGEVAISTYGSSEPVNITNNGWKMKPGLLGENLQLINSSSSPYWDPNWKAGVNVPLTWFATFLDLPPASSSAVFAIDVTGLNRGFLWVNGRGIGRYWLTEGISPPCSGCILTEEYQATNCRIACGLPSQKFYHVPADWLNPTNNFVVVFEEFGGTPSLLNIVAFDNNITSSSDVVALCEFVTENESLGVLCPPGSVVTDVTNAFFGNPGIGVCGALQPGSCNSDNSLDIVSSACLGRSYCFVNASIDVFGDPCPGTGKSLSAEFICQ